MLPCLCVAKLYGIGATEKFSEFNSLSVEGIIYMNIDIIVNDEVVRSGGSAGKKQ